MINIYVKKNSFRSFNLDWWKPTQKTWSKVLLEDHKVPWSQQVDPTTNKPWAALTPNYAIAKLKRYPGQPILRATGQMLDNAKIIPDKDGGFSVKVASYGIYHQYGTRKMVSRPWVGIPDTSMQKLPEIAWKNILKRKP